MLSGEIREEDRAMDGEGADSIRELVLATLRDLGATDGELAQITDTLLIREGRYYGRSFRTEQHMAMWMAGLVQFYGADGEMLRTILLKPEPRQHARAA
jgi:hypothetical protein